MWRKRGAVALLFELARAVAQRPEGAHQRRVRYATPARASGKLPGDARAQRRGRGTNATNDEKLKLWWYDCRDASAPGAGTEPRPLRRTLLAFYARTQAGRSQSAPHGLCAQPGNILSAFWRHSRSEMLATFEDAQVRPGLRRRVARAPNHAAQTQAAAPRQHEHGDGRLVPEAGRRRAPERRPLGLRGPGAGTKLPRRLQDALCVPRRLQDALCAAWSGRGHRSLGEIRADAAQARSSTSRGSSAGSA